MTDPTNVFAMDDIKFMTGYNVEPVVASETAVARGDRQRYYARRPTAARAGGARAATRAATSALDMADQGARGDCRSIADDDVEVLEELEEIERRVARAAGRARRRSSSSSTWC